MFGSFTGFFSLTSRVNHDDSSSLTPLPPSPCESRETPLSSADTPGPRSATPASPGVLSTPRSFLPFFRREDSTLVCPKPQKMPRIEDVAGIIADIFRKAGNMPEEGIDQNSLKRKSRLIVKEDGSTEQRDFYVYKKSPLAPSSEVFAFVAVELKPDGSTENFVYSKLKAATKQCKPGANAEDCKIRYEAALPFYLRASIAGIGPKTLKIQKNEGQPKPHQTLAKLANRGDFITLGCLRATQEIDVTDENVFNFCSQLLEKLIRLHAMRICHGDLKPENVLFHQEKDTWEVFICDYGFARDFSHAPSSIGSIGYQGTPEYLPPETNFTKLAPGVEIQIKDYSLNRQGDVFKADCYSLGITLFVMLSNNLFKQNFDAFIERRMRELCGECLSKEQLQQLASILELPAYGLIKAPFAKIFSLELSLYQAIALRTLFVEAFVDHNLKKDFPTKAEVIKGLIKQNPQERWSLEQALVEWNKE